VRVERTTGHVITGTLVGVAADAVRVADQNPVPVAEIRRVVVTAAAAQAEPPAVCVACVDGGMICGGDFSWDGSATAVVDRSEGRIELPVSLISTVTLRPPAEGEDAPAADWMKVLPESPESDVVVVVRSEDAGQRFEAVECAITAVTADAVTVVLDEERIPVKRAKVAGLRFVRSAAVGGGTQVAIRGGQLSARKVAWSPEGLAVDDTVRMPAALLESIDYAAGRTIRLETLAAERTDVEPFFGALGRQEGIAGFFSPRILAADAGHGFVVRPRTAAVWRVPPDSRTFRTSVSAAAGRQAAGAVVMTLVLDDREAFRRRVDAATNAVVELDVSAVRRLTVKVDFADGGGMGCAVRFAAPVFEK